MGSPLEAVRCVCFGEFTLNPRTGELRVNGTISYLQDKPLQVLVLLLERPGQLVTRDELMKRLWSADTFVDFRPEPEQGREPTARGPGGFQRTPSLHRNSASPRLPFHGPGHY